MHQDPAQESSIICLQQVDCQPENGKHDFEEFSVTFGCLRHQLSSIFLPKVFAMLAL